jgi:uncharacterized protein (TIGR03083 family)
MSTTPTMTPDQIWQAVDAHRADLTALLDELTDDEWRQPSLCTGWTVRDVAAHLTLQQLRFRDLPGIMRHWRGNLDRTNQHVARLRAQARTTGQIIAEIRAMIGSRRHNMGVTPLETLCDILVHSQDIAIPLGRRLDLPTDASAVAAGRVLSMRWPPPLPVVRKLAGLRLTATDTAWSVGSGPELRGPMAALLLVCCGRFVALSQLSGDGVAELTARATTLT